MDCCINVLLDETQQAVAWSRPSILIAVHKSKNDQARAIAAMIYLLGKNSMKVVTITSENGSVNILDGIIHELDTQETIFFVQDLGAQKQTYAGLNMYRESIVEHQIKVIFWLSLEEMVLLSRLAPDFWAFRHRVIEFPTGRSSRRSNLPSGVLIWHRENPILTLDAIQNAITSQEKLLQNIPAQNETIVSHAQAVGDLTYYHWSAGETQKVTSLLNQEIKQVESTSLLDLHSMLLNVQAINSFDCDEPHEALGWIERALELTPEWSLLWSNHGVICRSAGQGRKSLSSLKKAIKLNPSSYESWMALGYVYMSLGKYSTAILNFERAFTLHVADVRFYPALAICHTRIGNVDKFDEIMRELSELVKNDDYLSVCQDGLSGNISNALSRLKGLVLDDKIPRAFIRRDPIFHFIFGVSALRELLYDIPDAS